MATTQTTTDECKYCGDEIDEFYAPGYCSEKCYYTVKAEKVLRVARQDHRICGTCLAFVKEVDPPSEDWEYQHGSRVQAAIDAGAEYHNVDGGIALDATGCDGGRRTSVESVIGFQYQTTDAELAVKELTGPDEYARVYQTGTGCKCGSTDHSSTADVLRKGDPARSLANYVTTINLLEREGQLNQRVDKTVFFNAYRETRDFDVALGRALFKP